MFENATEPPIASEIEEGNGWGLLTMGEVGK